MSNKRVETIAEAWNDTIIRDTALAWGTTAAFNVDMFNETFKDRISIWFNMGIGYIIGTGVKAKQLGSAALFGKFNP